MPWGPTADDDERCPGPGQANHTLRVGYDKVVDGSSPRAGSPIASPRCSGGGRSGGGRRKNDVIDASAAASVAALQGDATPVGVDDDTVVFALLEDRRASLAAQRVRSVSQLHALLRDLVPAGRPPRSQPPMRPRCCARSATPPPPETKQPDNAKHRAHHLGAPGGI